MEKGCLWVERLKWAKANGHQKCNIKDIQGDVLCGYEWVWTVVSV